MRKLTILFLLAADAAAQTPTVLNLSHDLVTLGISRQNMTPDTPALDSRPLFQAAVAYASAHKIATVTADRGKYYFLSQNSDYQHVFLSDIQNVTIDLQYSDLYFAKGNVAALDFDKSTNVTLKNFTVDYLQLPFTQLTVTSVNAAARSIGIKQSGNYLLPSFFNSLSFPTGYINDGFYVFAFRNGQQLRTTGRMSTAGPLSDTNIQITGTEPWSQAAQIGTIQSGDTLVLELRAGLGAIFTTNTVNLTVQNVSVYASGFIGVFVVFGTATRIDHVQVIPRPGTDRLISTNADGIHLGGARANNAVTNNTVRRGCDDAIAIDGEWSAIVAAPNTGTTVQVKRHNTNPLPVGAAFDFINITNATIVGTATIVSEDPAPAAQTGVDGEPITLTLDHAVNRLQANFGVTANDPKQRGAGTVISNNLVQDETYARGIYPAGVANVTINDNMVESTNQSGILIEQDEGLIYGYKTGPSSAITIHNNIVDHALGYGIPGNPFIGLAGAINTVAYDQVFNWVATSSLSGIDITGNWVTNSPGTGIRMENVNGGQLSGNTILNSSLQPNEYLWYLPAGETLAQAQADTTKALLLVNSTSVVNSDNATSGSWTVNLSNADGGYRLAPESIAVAYGSNLAPSLVQAGVQPLPKTLGGITVSVKDSAGVTRPAGVYYVSPSQIAYVVPKGSASGVATVSIAGKTSAAFIAPVGPSILAANGTGSGVALAGAVRVSASGAQTPVTLFQCGAAGCSSVPMDLGTSTETLVIVFYGTGIRGNSGLANVVASIGGTPAQVTYAGSQGQFDGLDQVNIYVPRSLAGSGEIPVVLTVDGVTANVVTVNIK